MWSSCCRPTSLNPVRFLVSPRKVDLSRRNRVGVRASTVESHGSSNFAHRMERAWLISQQPTPVSCSSCGSKGHVECKWCNGTGFFIIGDNMLCQVPSRNTTCVICSGKDLTARCTSHGYFGAHLSGYVPSGKPLSPLLRVLRGQNWRRPYYLQRFFFSGSSFGADLVDPLLSAAKHVEAGEEALKSKYSSVIVPSVVIAEDCPTVEVTNSALRALFEKYCREAGGRNFQVQNEKIYRKIALKLVRQGAQMEPSVGGAEIQTDEVKAESDSVSNETVTVPSEAKSIDSSIDGKEWSQLKAIIESSNPTDFLSELLHFKTFNTDLILSFFKWSQHVFNVTHSIEHYVKLFILLGNEKKYSKIRSLLHLLVKQGKPISISTFGHTLLTLSDNACANSIVFDMFVLSCVNNGKLELALEGFRRAGNYGFKLSVVSCNPMLAALVNEGRIRDVAFVYKEMIRRRIELNLITFNTVIHGFCKAGRLNKAGDIVEDMKVYGVVPNVVTYNALIAGYCKRGGPGRMYKADMLLKEMVERGVSPNVITYNTLIDGFCKDDNVAASIRVFKDMKEQGLGPSVITYNSLINGLCGDGKIDEAVLLRDQMLEWGLEPNIVTYNAFIHGYAKEKMLKEARELFDSIAKKGVVANVLTYNTLINGYCKAGDLGEAMAVYNLMSDKMVSPSVSTYNCLIGGYYNDGNLEAAHKLLAEMEDKGLKGDVVTYNIRIDAMCKRSETRKAVRFLDEMLQKGLSPSHVTYNALVAGYCEQGNFKGALTMKKRMEKEGKWPNVVTYNVLIKGFCESGKLKEANRFLNEMLEKGLVPNRITYDIIKEEMMEKGFVPDIDGHLYNDLAKS